MKQCFRLIITFTVFYASLGNISYASLLNRGNGLIYDDELDITWLRDVKYAKTINYVTPEGRRVAETDGKMSWDEANEWVQNLQYANARNWRLPDVKPINGINFQDHVTFDGSTDFGENITSKQSELSYMYYVNLGGKSVHDTSGRLVGCGKNGNCLNNPDPFVNLAGGGEFWTGVEAPVGFAWTFNTMGIQTPHEGKENLLYAWAVHPGDVASIPLPSSILFFFTSLLALHKLKNN
jgi:hypothetical protein